MTQALALPDEKQFRDDFAAITRFQRIVRSQMIAGHDFGVIPGTQKPTLLKPGAEKIAKLLGLADTYQIMDRQEDWGKGFFRYLVCARLTHVASGAVISEGLGECNSMEAKYRWRESKRRCPVCQAEAIVKGRQEYGGGWLCFKKQGGCGAKWPDGAQEIESQATGRIENDDIYSQVNTILKMAKKRALVDAALSAGRLSDIFTQDIEDFATKGAAVDLDGEEAEDPEVGRPPPRSQENPVSFDDARRAKAWADDVARRAPEASQEATDGGAAAPEPPQATPPRVHGPGGKPYPIKGEKETDATYFIRVARESCGLGIGEAYAALGKGPASNGRWTWTAWESEGHTLQEALDKLPKEA